MGNLYLTPATIGNLAQLILTLAIAIYLTRLGRRPGQQPDSARPTRLLAAFFASSSLFIFLLLADSALPPADRYYALFLQNVPLALALLILLQFAYAFPSAAPRYRSEARVVFALSLLYILAEGYLAFHRFALLLNQGLVEYRPPNADLPLVITAVWVLVMLLRQMIRTASNPAPAGWWRKLWRPQGRPAQTARSFAFIFTLLTLLTLVEVAYNYSYLSSLARDLLLSLGVSFSLFTFALIYINYLPESTTFMVRLVGMALVSLLVILGAAGWLSQPALNGTYPADVVPQNQQSFRFTPNDAGGYEVSKIPFSDELLLESRLPLADSDASTVELPFAFPFAGRQWQQLVVHDDGMVTFGPAEPIAPRQVFFHYGRRPTLFAFYRDLNPTYIPATDETAGIYSTTESGRVVIAWNQLPEEEQRQFLYTFQLALYPDGSFEVTHHRLGRLLPAHALSNPNYGLVGALTAVPPQPTYLVLTTDLPFSSAGGGVLHDPYLTYRAYLHRLMTPLCYLVLASSAFVLFVFPIFFRRHLITPLEKLLQGMKLVNDGNLDVEMPILYYDEIGFLTRSFNGMVGELRFLVTSLEHRVAERTQALEEQKARLAESEARYRELVEAIDEAIFKIAIPAGVYEYISPAAQKVFGVPPETLQADPGRLWQMLHPEFAAVARVEWANWLAGRITPNYEFKIIDPAGQERWIQQSNKEIYEEASGQLVAVEGIYRDITSLKRAEEQLRQQQREFATLAERERIGQELHDSLGQMMGYVNVQAQAAATLLGEGQIPEAEATLTQLALIAQDAHADIREYILGMRGTAAARLDFFTALDQYLNKFAGYYAIQTQVSRPPGLATSPFAPDVETQLLRIIQEALNNIRKHAGVSAAQLLFLQESNYIQVIIADAGRGFDPATLPASGPIRPAGDEVAATDYHLGLDIMRQRAESVGGRLDIHSAPGHGTQVIARMPRVTAAIPAVGDAEPGPGGKGRSSLRVVLVDDHPLFLDGLRNMLVARGLHIVGLGADGLEAQELARRLRPDVMVMDIHMPRCNGLEATRLIKAEFPDIKIVILTVAAEDDLLFEALRQGASGYLLKNLDSSNFFDLLAEVARGEVVLSPGLATRVWKELAQREAAGPAAAEEEQATGLSARQVQILKEVAQGATYKEVATTLYISEATVKYHMGEILEQLQLKSRREAIAYARQLGLA